MSFQPQRIRDPLHNLIQFRADEFENAMWRVLQTRPFQRLRRVKQLGFSELVYPGATHTRFAHSLGVFHTARLLVGVIESQLGQSRFEISKARVALAAALLHDLGHGPFSHAFEDVGKRHDLKMAKHERLSDVLIRDSEVSDSLKTLGSGFAADVADVVGSAGPKNIYGAVVSSQFDADRLDYMRRDRLMTGTHHGAIDFDWLLSNIEIGKVPYGVDEENVGELETFVLGPKATYAAESYLLGLFQLYPTVYFHKTTRGAEKLFSEILYRVIELVRQDSGAVTGLPDSHPLILFAQDPNAVEHVLQLDDTVVWGALSLMVNSTDQTIKNFSLRLRDRRLFKCFDVLEQVAQSMGKAADPGRISTASVEVEKRVREWLVGRSEDRSRILIDRAIREPYKKFEESKGPLNQIMLRKTSGDLVDVAKLSRVVAAIEPFVLFRLYAAKEDAEATNFIKLLLPRKRGGQMSSGKFNDFEKVTQIIRDADGKIVGRTRLQKIAFLLEATGLGEGFDFEYRHYGPYSEQLADAISVGVMVGSLAEEERATNWGGTYSIFTVSSNVPRHASGSRRALIAAASAADPVALELAATAAFLANEGEANPWDETARRKPEKAAARLAEAKSLYDELASIDTPKRLPHIRASAGAV